MNTPPDLNYGVRELFEFENRDTPGLAGITGKLITLTILFSIYTKDYILKIYRKNKKICQVLFVNKTKMNSPNSQSGATLKWQRVSCLRLGSYGLY
jgi:hypothetical protein